jgi:hypothetical protein
MIFRVEAKKRVLKALKSLVLRGRIGLIGYANPRSDPIPFRKFSLIS